VFVRRGRKVYLRTAPGGPGTEPQGGGGAPAPAPAPAAFDPANPPAEVKAYLDAERRRIAAEEGGKARDTARTAAAEAAKADVLKTLAEALGVKPADVDPAKLVEQLNAAHGEVRIAKVDKEVGRVARILHADEDLIGALLEKKHRAALAALDPAADDFASKVEALVKAEVEANPRLKLDAAPVVTPPGGQAPAAAGFQQPPATGQRMGLAGAILKHYGG
jgi:hypothetical protein